MLHFVKGFSVCRRLGTPALHYDGVEYKDKEQLFKIGYQIKNFIDIPAFLFIYPDRAALLGVIIIYLSQKS